jgi:sigma-B regulation protein RsbU (phosphoserine phosphatase)
VLRSGERASFLKSQNGIALAVDESAAYIEHKLRLQLDDVLFLYTDGVTEAQNEQGVLFGDRALLETLASAPPGSSVEALSDRVVTAVRDFAGDAPQADDITCVTLRFTGSGTR